MNTLTTKKPETKVLYMIRDWDRDYETAESRKLESMRWVAYPINTDGLLFRGIAQQKNRSELLAAMTMILQVAGRSRRGQRGTLTYNGRALDAYDMSVLTGWPASTFEIAFAYFSSPEIGWLAALPPASPAAPADSPGALPPPAGDPADSSGVPPLSAENLGDSPATGQGGPEGRTRENMEHTPASCRKPTKFGSVYFLEQPEPVRSRMLRLNAIVRRNNSTRWVAKEFDAFKHAGLDRLSDEDFNLQAESVNTYYAAPVHLLRRLLSWKAGDDYRRRGLLTLLNNWSQAVDAAESAVPLLQKNAAEEAALTGEPSVSVN